MQVKIFESANPDNLARQVNEFIHPINGARLGKLHYSVRTTGMATIHSCMVEYVELEGTDEPVIRVD